MSIPTLLCIMTLTLIAVITVQHMMVDKKLVHLEAIIIQEPQP